MGRRGPKTEHEPIFIPGLSEKRPKPLRDMTKRAKSLWREIVDSLPPDYFRPSDLPLLRSYCEAASSWELANLKVQEYGSTVKTSWGERVSPWVTMRKEMTGEMRDCATKLRLCVNSRMDTRKAGKTGIPKTDSKRRDLMFHQ